MTVSILEQRRIEAAFAKGIFEEMTATLGEEQATSILSSAIIKLAQKTGATMAAEAPEPSIAHFAELMERWKLDDALRIEVLRQDETHFDFNVTRCRYAESYREMGLGKLGAVLSCNRDGAFCEGYDPKLKLERTQTIMSGATHCNFRYTREA
ncbi:MAG: 2-amino-thiazoline-4-carboxylic acid hydrolase [Rubritepida sp.]|nr:2-amino-thiazoline-4-carboxylic acid hydrolase [Rubritepida sp.]